MTVIKAEGVLGFSVKPDAAPLFTPVKLGAFELKHRVVMAPLTRCRSPNNVPTSEVASYYGQRASPGGLIISEATAIAQDAHGYPQVPGIHRADQIAAWRPVVDAVHAKGGVFVSQLWHVGRASHPEYSEGRPPVSASAIAIGSGFDVYGPTGSGPFPYPTPRALEADEIPGIIAAYAAAAKNAREAGFDGIEVHAANGYLLDQFWKDATNQRTDAYGGSTEGKARLILEVMEAVAGAIGAERCGIRLSPYNSFLDATEPDVDTAISKNVWLCEELGRRVPGLAYVHMVEPRLAGGNAEIEGPIAHSLDPFRAATQQTNTPFLAAGGFKRAAAIEAIEEGRADAVVFGRYFISNPDLPKRLAIDAPLTKYDRDTFYSWGNEGYTTYKTLDEE